MPCLRFFQIPVYRGGHLPEKWQFVNKSRTFGLGVAFLRKCGIILALEHLEC